jgi:hypothetical protein
MAAFFYCLPFVQVEGPSAEQGVPHDMMQYHYFLLGMWEGFKVAGKAKSVRVKDLPKPIHDLYVSTNMAVTYMLKRRKKLITGGEKNGWFLTAKGVTECERLSWPVGLSS